MCSLDSDKDSNNRQEICQQKKRKQRNSKKGKKKKNNEKLISDYYASLLKVCFRFLFLSFAVLASDVAMVDAHYRPLNISLDRPGTIARVIIG